MSEEVNKTIEAENKHILDALHNDEAIYVYAYWGRKLLGFTFTCIYLHIGACPSAIP